MNTNAPIFIVGANRSGTTLLRLILNAHPRIAIPEELNYFNPWMADNWRMEASDRDTFRHWVHRYLHQQLPSGAFGNTDLSAFEEEIVRRADTYDWRELYQGALESWAARHDKVRWGEKTPGNLFYVDTLQTMFPEAQFIHLVRDPRAGVRSMQNTSFFVDDLLINALNRRKYLREGLRRDASMPPNCWTRVYYEDLLTTPEETLRSLCRFLGEQFTPAMLTYYENAEQYMSPAAAQEFNRAARRPIDPSKAHRWRNTLSPKEITAIETICRREMETLGYPLEGPSPSLSNHAVIAAWTAYWRFADRKVKAPDYIVSQSPTDRLRRIPHRLRAALSNYFRHPLSSNSSSSE